MNQNSRLGKKLISAVFLFFSLIILALLIGSFLFHNREIDNLCKDRASRLTKAASELIDGDYVRQLSDAVSTNEYQTLREEAVQKDDADSIITYLKEKDLYSGYENCTDILLQLCDPLDGEYLYVQNLEGNDVMFLFDSHKTILNLGLRDIPVEGPEGQTSNAGYAPTIKKYDSGWLCTGANPIVSSDNKNVAVVGVRLYMNGLLKRRRNFQLIMFILSIGVLFTAAIFGFFYIKKTVSDPIFVLAQNVSIFGATDEDDLPSQVVQVTTPRQDEIGDLYRDIRQMQLGIIRYMENLRSATEEKERMDTELNIATRIQASMLPTTFPAFPDRDEFDVYALMKPAKGVAGDFYDFFLTDDDHLAVLIADVSGKGIPASLFMMMAKIVITNIAQREELPHKVLERSNAVLSVNNDEDMFVTVWLGILTISTGHVVASNAGHEYPAMQNDQGVFELFHDKHGLVLGGMAGLKYKDYEFDLKKGQTLFLYTDGVPEATTAENEQFGTDRMVEALNLHPESNPRDLVHFMLRTVDDFDGDVPQFDDITMVALRYNGPAG